MLSRASGLSSLPSFILGWLLTSPLLVLGEVDYNKQIQPILAKHCFHCHGPDGETRKADLRLDTKEGLLGVEGLIIPKDPAKSELIVRVRSKDSEERMPPPDFKHQLSDEHKNLLDQWIKEGAKWSQHWAFTKATAPQIPWSPSSSTNPIDAFVHEKLATKGWHFAPPAKKHEILRRVSFDLTGLPPSPELIHSFLQDESDLAYDKVVDRLLDSTAYGEHRARYWLDAARYADTHGLHFDNYREIWPYRDWVISAFNRNLPFDQFTIEQIAGDLLPNPKPEQLVATGFQRCNMTTNEGGTIDEETLATYAADRVQTLSWVYLGLTFNCAQCHDHKFDPITMKDYYAMAAFFRNTTQPAKDGNIKANGPTLVLPSNEDKMYWDRVNLQIEATESLISKLNALPLNELEKLKDEELRKSLLESLPHENLVADIPFHSSAVVEGISEELAFSERQGVLGHAHVIQKPIPLKLDKLPKLSFDQPFTISLWIKTNKLQNSQSVISHMDPHQKLKGWDIFLEKDKVALHFIDRWPDNALKVITVDRALKPNRWHQLTVTHTGSGKPLDLNFFVDGKPFDLKVVRQSLQESFNFVHNSPFVIGGRLRDSTFKEGSVQGIRIYDRQLYMDEIHEQGLVGQIYQEILKQPNSPNPKLPQNSLKEWYRLNRLEGYRDNFRLLGQLKLTRASIQDRSPVSLIQEEIKDQMPMTEILLRGQYDKLGEKVTADVPEALMPFSKGSPKNRLGLAQWLVHPDHPLTARVTVNRFWQEVFGTGLVASTEDFGLMGNQPSHPELLDWLANYFIKSGWNVKQLYRLIVTSQTYQQSAINPKVSRDLDPENRWLSRGPRFRMDAEMIRDAALKSSGLYHAKLGGPGIRPYQPEGIWDMVGMPGSNTRDYVQDKDENQYRRSLYQFWKRMAPPPNLETFNAPSREVSCVRRERTNTPLQALVLLNDPQFVQAAIHLASVALQENPKDPLLQMSLRSLGRSLTEDEARVIRSGYSEFLDHFQRNQEALRNWLAYDSELKLEPTPELGAWAIVAQQLMNLDEFITK